MLNECNLHLSDWVSVVVPTHNRSELLLNALESISIQTFRPIEIVVVDDGSTDGILDIICEWAAKNETPEAFLVRCVKQTNQGPNAARNRGIRESRGEFIAFLDSDDRWLPEKLKKQISVLKSDADIGGVYCGLSNIDLITGEKFPSEPRSYPQGNLLQKLLIHDITEATSCWIVRKNCFMEVGAFDIELPARQDWDMWIRLSAQYRIGCVPEVLVEMGNHPGERVRSKAEREISAHKTIFRKYAHLRAQFPFWVSLAARSAMYRRRGRVYFHRGISKRKAVLMQLLAISVWPFNFDSYAALAGMAMNKSFRQKLHIAWNRIFGKTRFAIRTH